LGMIKSVWGWSPIIHRFTNIYHGVNSSETKAPSFFWDWAQKKWPLKGSKHADKLFSFFVPSCLDGFVKSLNFEFCSL
jgi:hypothetical protein